MVGMNDYTGIEQTSQKLSHSDGSPMRALVVDDEESIRALLTGFVESLGCQAYTSADAEGALRLLRVRPVDLVLVDMRMPHRDGAWLIEQIHAQWPALPIVIATGVPELDPHVTLRPGVAGYVLKPFDFAELKAALERVLKPGHDPLV